MWRSSGVNLIRCEVIQTESEGSEVLSPGGDVGVQISPFVLIWLKIGWSPSPGRSSDGSGDKCVCVPPDLPEISVSHSSVLVREGDNVTVSCNGTGLPLPEVDWTVGQLNSINTHMVRPPQKWTFVCAIFLPLHPGHIPLHVTQQQFSCEHNTFLQTNSLDLLWVRERSASICSWRSSSYCILSSASLISDYHFRVITVLGCQALTCNLCG